MGSAKAFVVISQNFDHAALVDAAMSRALKHTKQFGF